MRKLRKCLVLLLSVAMLTSSTGMAVLAQEQVETKATEAEQAKVASEVPAAAETTGVGGDAAKSGNTTTETTEKTEEITPDAGTDSGNGSKDTTGESGTDAGNNTGNTETNTGSNLGGTGDTTAKPGNNTGSNGGDTETENENDTDDTKTEDETEDLDNEENLELTDGDAEEIEAELTEETEEELEEEEEETEEAVELINPATVIYNLGSKEITVGYDPEKAETPGGTYQLFDEEENYTIHLEDNAFFPYEVQFKFGDNVVVEWFDTPESTVTVDGHIFGVYTEQNDDTKISQIGVWVGDAYIAAKPKAKTFTNPRITPRSLLPLDVIEVDLDLSDYYRYELTAVKISAMLSKLNPAQEFDGTEKIAWMRAFESYYDPSGAIHDTYYDDKNYTIAEPAEELNFLQDFTDFWRDQYFFEMIVGSALQLDESNTRYMVDVTLKTGNIAEMADTYKSVGGVRSQVTPLESTSGVTDAGDGVVLSNIFSQRDKDAETLYISMDLHSDYTDNVTVKVYKGTYISAEDAETAVGADSSIDVTDELLNQDMTVADAGYAIQILDEAWYEFSLIFEDNNGNAKGILHASVYIAFSESESTSSFNNFSGSLYEQSGAASIVRTWTTTIYSMITNYTFGVPSDIPVDGTYYLRMVCPADSRSSITKAVEGHYNSEAETVDLPNIKEQLFPADPNQQGSGFAADYSGSGKKFTVFMDGKVHQIIVNTIGVTIESSIEYLSMYGAKELSNDAYIIRSYDDDYSYMGYQTIFYIDDVPLNSLTPYFSTFGDVNVYAGDNVDGAGTPQVSGVTKQDFSLGPVQYVSTSANGDIMKNYWVTFVKKHTGSAKLFVSGTNGAEAAEREILFTDSHKDHDIFIANIGDQTLTGLNVKLENEQNIRLDSYWTVGGENNDQLAAFNTTQVSREEYAELANVAKIRLLQDGTGEIAGTLTISADGQEAVVLTLTGNTDDLELTTENIPEAVKYVPYATQILHNNKYSWNTVTLQITAGTLPNGVTLKPTGELYGTPKEAGDFTFTVQMLNSDSRFSSVSKEYTLSVQDNTDANVNQASDESYNVEQPVGTLINSEYVITDIADYEWISAGKFEEFVAFWLNGDKLAEGTEYTKAPGSTKITILGQTFRNKANNNGVNTIAAEFRVGGDENKELKRTAQNFVLELDAEDLIDEEPETPSNSNNSNNQSGTGNSNNQNNTGNSGNTGTQSSTSAPQPVSTNTNIPTGLGRNGDGISPEAILFWNNVIGQLQSKAAQMNGNHFTMDVLTGTKVFVPANVLENIRNAGATLALHTGQSVTFSLSSGDIPLEVLGNGIDLSSDVGKTAIPEALVKAMGEGSITSKLVSMDSHANFGMKVDLHFSLGKENAGKYANLYRYNVANGRMEYLGSYQINSDGQAMFGITKGADFLLTVTTQRPNEAPIDEGSTYTVIPGDMMLSIASKLGVTISQLRGWNPAIRDFNRIYPGQLIYY